MSRSNWRYYLALGWLAPLAVLLGYGVALIVSGGDLLHCKKPHASGSNATRQQKPISIPEPVKNEFSCRDERSERDEKCQSWRQAEAAEDQACVARRQFYAGAFIGLLGLMGLAGTVIFTKQAADGALQAADAAQRSLNLSKEIARQQTIDASQSQQFARQSASASLRSANAAEHALRALERPYLFIEKIEGRRLVISYPDHKPAIEYTIVNFGKTPAILRSLNVRLEHDPGPKLRLPMLRSKQFYSVVEPGMRLMWPGSVDGSGAVEVDGSSKGQTFPGPLAKSIVFHGSIFYEGPTGALYRDRFCFRAGDNAETFHPDGGDEYNRRETLVDPAERRRDQEDS